MTAQSALALEKLIASAKADRDRLRADLDALEAVEVELREKNPRELERRFGALRARFEALKVADEAALAIVRAGVLALVPAGGRG